MDRKRILLILDFYDYRIHRGVAKVAAQEKWSLFFYQSIDIIPEDIKGWNFDGILTMTYRAATIDHLRANDIPIVDMGLADHHLKVHRVVTDYEACGRLAAEHLFERGYRVGLLGQAGAGNDMLNQRNDSFARTFDHLGGETHLFDPLGSDDKIPHLKTLLKRYPKPLALFATNDNYASHYFIQVSSMGYEVPTEVAIVGADNNELVCESIETPLSSVENDQEGLGERAATTLARIIEDLNVGPAGATIPTIQWHPAKAVISRASSNAYVSSDPMVAKAFEWIQKHVCEPVSAVDMAEALGISQQQLQLCFKKGGHDSPGKCLERFRLHRAKAYLRHSKDSVKVIAIKMGYNSELSFHRTFKRNEGITPAKWRKL